MKRKLLFVSLVVALSTVGFAKGTNYEDDCNEANTNLPDLNVYVKNMENTEIKPLKDKVAGLETSVNDLSDVITNIETSAADAGKAADKANNRLDVVESTNKEQNGRLDALETGKVDKDDYIKDKATISEEIGKVDQKVEETDARVDKVVEVNKEQTNKINANTDKINDLSQKLDNEVIRQDYKNKVQDGRLDKVEDKNKEQDGRLDKVENKNEEQDGRLDKVENKNEELQGQINDFQGQMNNYGSRIDNLEKRVDNLDNKLNKGLSLMAAMNAVDFQDVAEGEMAIGAGVGHYGNAQSVAIGVAYAPTQNLNVNMKYSVTAGDVDSFAIGAGASYKFRVK